MRRPVPVLAVTLTLALSIGSSWSACAAPTPAPPTVTVQLEDTPDLGRVMADLNGHTLYRDNLDTPTTIACTGTCADIHKPFPYHTGQTLALPPGIAGTLGHLLRPDGSEQITYDGEPLYTNTNDHYPADTQGQGGHWHAIQPRNAPGH